MGCSSFEFVYFFSFLFATATRYPATLVSFFARRMVLYALKDLSSSVRSAISISPLLWSRGWIVPLNWLIPLASSPFFRITRLAMYVFRRFVFNSKDSSDLLTRRWSTAIPIVRAYLALNPAALISSKVKPFPNFCLAEYFWVWHWTIGRSF